LGSGEARTGGSGRIKHADIHQTRRALAREIRHRCRAEPEHFGTAKSGTEDGDVGQRTVEPTIPAIGGGVGIEPAELDRAGWIEREVEGTVTADELTIQIETERGTAAHHRNVVPHAGGDVRFQDFQVFHRAVVVVQIDPVRPAVHHQGQGIVIITGGPSEL